MRFFFRNERPSLKGPIKPLKQTHEEARPDGTGAESEGLRGEGEEPSPGPAFLRAHLLPFHTPNRGRTVLQQQWVGMMEELSCSSFRKLKRYPAEPSPELWSTQDVREVHALG